GEPDNVLFHSDLGAALIEKAKTEESEGATGPSVLRSGRATNDRAAALEQFDRAAKLNPRSPEALFNRAICLQQFPMTLRAEQAWREYLALDSGSGWATEATRYIETLQQKKQESSRDLDRLIRGFDEAYKARDDTLAWTILGSSI